MKFLKAFPDHEQYEEYAMGGEAVYPYACRCDAENETHFDEVKPYITSGLVFHLDGEDYDDVNKTWTDRIQNDTFTMYNTSVSGEGGVSFNGSTSYGTMNKSYSWSYNSSTIEVVVFRKGGIVYATGNGSAIQYIGSSHANINYNSTKRMAGAINKLYTHSMTNTTTIVNGVKLAATTDNTWGLPATGTTWIGGRNTTTGNYRLNGVLYQIRIYNRKLTEEEMLYNQEQDRKRYGIIFDNNS